MTSRMGETISDILRTSAAATTTTTTTTVSLSADKSSAPPSGALVTRNGSSSSPDRRRGQNRHPDVTRHGNYRHKYHLRALFQSVAFVGLIIASLIYYNFFPSSSSLSSLNNGNFIINGRSHWGATRAVGGRMSSSSFLLLDDLMTTSTTSAAVSQHRRLEEEASDPLVNATTPSMAPAVEECDTESEPAWLIALYALGVLYMFLALAIVCDEFFVPALEEISSSRRMNLSMDVAGATLMAAGGSAPELFSSLFGTFAESEIGFGTIIGSAVFNVLFVIAMCSVFAKETLALTWWPLFRDAFCYAVGLIVLAVFVGVLTKESIVFWEAATLFIMYIAYVLIMWKNAEIYKYLTGKELEPPKDEDEVVDDEQWSPAESDPERPAVTRVPSMSSLNSAANLSTLQASLANKQSSYFSWQGTFRAGILKLMRDPTSWVETGGVGIVSKIAGDANFVFRQIDENQDGHVDKGELKKLFDALECRVTESELEEVFTTLDVDRDGVINEEEFNRWYTSSAELIRSQVRHVFDELDKDNSGTLDKYEVKALLLELDPRVTDDDVADAVDAMYKHGSREEIAFDEFESWYEQSMIYERQKKMVEEDMEGVFESLKPPRGQGFLNWVQFIVVYPLVVAMAFTIPDVRRPGMSKYCYASFILSISWIGGFAFLMVTWAELIGDALGIPSVVMGLTVLAAGTSVPDLLSSVIVARRGSGDMAVSSSIGSNIFDILVGLPIPWMMYTAYPTKPDEVTIGSDNIFTSLAILLVMLVLLIGAVHSQGWKLTKTLGGIMMVFYFGFLVQAIWVELPFEKECT